MAIATPSLDRIKPSTILRSTRPPSQKNRNTGSDDSEVRERETRLAAVEGSEKIELLIEMADDFARKDLSQAEVYARQAIELAARLDDKNRHVKACNSLGTILIRQGNFKASVACFEGGLAHQNEVQDVRSIAIAHGGLSTACVYLGDFERASRHCQMSLEIARDNGFKLQYANALTTFAGIYQFKADYLNCLKYQIEALTIYEELGDAISPHYVPGALVNIGVLYDRLGDSRKSLEYQLKAYEVQQRNQDRRGLMMSSINISNLYARTGNYDQSLHYQQKVLHYARELGDRHKICISLLNLGYAAANQGDYAASFSYYQRGYQMATEMNQTSSMALSKLGMAQAALARNQIGQAREFGLEALHIAQRSEDVSRTLQSSQLLAQIYAEHGDYREAYEFMALYERTRMKLNNDEQNRQLNELRAKFDAEQAEKERRELKYQLERKNQEIAAIAQKLGEKRRIIAELEERLAYYKRQSDSEDKKQILDRFMLEVKHKYLNTSDDNQTIRELFNTTYPGFAERLQAQYPDLTPQELKVCALVLVGLTTREIADVFYLAKRSVDNHRYNLRKKLDIDTDVDLRDWLNDFWQLNAA